MHLLTPVVYFILLLKNFCDLLCGSLCRRNVYDDSEATKSVSETGAWTCWREYQSRAGKNLGFLEKVFRFLGFEGFLGFNVRKRT